MSSQNNTLRSGANTWKETTSKEEELKNWAKHHAFLTSLLLDAYCIVDLSNHVIDFNVAFTDLCGESYRKILKRGNFCELLKTENCPHHCPGKLILSSQKMLRIDELKGSSKAFPELKLILAGTPIFSEQNEIMGALITIRNVSAESELQKKYDERTIESITDGLTGLYNKMFTDDAISRAIKSSLREIKTFSILMCDIDHFKSVNDNFGHLCGDYVLATIAKLLKAEIRDTDIGGRFGGEEFIVILNNTNIAGAHIFADRFRNKVANTKIFFEGRHIPVTVSIGLATFNERWKPGLSIERLLKEIINHADSALYAAKAGGRNRICEFSRSSKNEKNKN